MKRNKLISWLWIFLLMGIGIAPTSVLAGNMLKASAPAFTEDFEDNAEAWTLSLAAIGSYGSNFGPLGKGFAAAEDGAKYLYINATMSTSEFSAVSPAMDLSALQAPILKFRYQGVGGTFSGQFVNADYTVNIYESSDNNTWTLAGNILINGDELAWKDGSVNLKSSTTSIKIAATAPSGFFGVAMDVLSVEEGSTTPPPAFTEDFEDNAEAWTLSLAAIGSYGSNFGPLGKGFAAAEDGAKYLYINATMSTSEFSAVSPAMDLSALQAPILKFRYQGVGGTFSGQFVNADYTVNIYESSDNNTWTLAGNILINGDELAWKDGSVNLKSSTTSIKIAATAPSGFFGVAMDVLSVEEGSTTPPPAFTEDFEDNTEAWTLSLAAIGSFNTNFGPLGKTFAAAEDGAKYLYINATMSTNEFSAVSPAMDLSALQAPILKFRYQGVGGTFSGQFVNADYTVNIYESSDNSTWTLAGSILINGDELAWKDGSVNLKSSTTSIKIAATAPSGFFGVAMDVLSVEEGFVVSPDLIMEGFESETCVPETWTVTSTTEGKTWVCGPGNGAGGAIGPNSVPEGTKAITFTPESGTALTLGLTSPELDISSFLHANLSLKYYIAQQGYGSATSLKISTSEDGTAYTDLILPAVTNNAWTELKFKIAKNVKYIRFTGIYSGMGMPVGTWFDDIQLIGVSEEEEVQVKSISESFEAGFPPEHWTMDAAPNTTLDIHTAGGRVEPYKVQDGTKALMYKSLGNWYTNENKVSLLTPKLDLSELSTPVLSFYYWSGLDGTETIQNYIDIYVSIDGDNFTQLLPQEGSYRTLIPASSKVWKRFITKLDKGVKIVKIEFHNNGSRNGGAPNSNLLIDMLSLGEAECYAPSEVAISEITKHTATASWKAFSETDKFSYAYGPRSSFVASEASYTDINTAKTINLSELDADTEYAFAVKTICGETPSEEISVVYFNTLPLCPAPKDISVDKITSEGAEFTWIAEDANSYILGYQNIPYEYMYNWASSVKSSATTSSSVKVAMSPEDANFYVGIKAVCGTDTSALSSLIQVVLPASCPAPASLVVSDIATSGFVCSWDKGEQSAWKLKLTPKKGSEQIVDAQTETYTFSNLQAGSEYSVSVAAVCGEKTSKYSTPVEVTTLCAVINEDQLPYNQDFEEVGTRQTLLPCLSTDRFGEYDLMRYHKQNSVGVVKTKGTVSVRLSSAQYVSGNQVLANETFYFPSFSLKANHKYLIKYSDAVSRFGNSDEFENVFTAKIIAQPTEGELIEIGTVDKINVEGWQDYEVEFIPIADGDYKIGLQLMASNYVTGSFYLFDNFQVSRITDCAQPTELAVSEISRNSAKVSFTSEADNFQIRYGKTIDFASQKEMVSFTQSPYVLEDLDAETSYTFQMRSICAEGDTSSWTTATDFTTDLACPAPKELVASDITSSQIKLAWTAGADETQWEINVNKGIQYDTLNDSRWMKLSKKDTLLTNLQHSSYYAVALRAVCGELKSVNVKSYVASLCEKQNAPYVQDFEEMLSGQLPLCYTSNHPAGLIPETDGGMAGLAASRSGKGFIRLQVANGFIYTPKVHFEAGKQYLISAWVMGNDTTTDKVRIATGSAANTEAMNTAVEEKIFKIMEYQEVKTIVRFEEAQDLHIGIYAVSTGMGAIDDISVLPYCGNIDSARTIKIEESTATLTWSSTADSFAIEYKIKDSTNVYKAATSSSSYLLENLKQNTEYLWRVKTLCSYGDGPWSAWVSFKTKKQLCAKPSELVVSAITFEGASFTWKSTVDNADIRYRKFGEEAWKEESVTAAKTIKVLGLSAKTKYQWQVRSSCTASDKSDWVEGTEFTTLALPCAVPVALSSDEITDSSAVISWMSTATSFQVRLKKKSDAEYTYYTTSKTEFTCSDLTQDTDYEWGVSSICTDSSDWAVDAFKTLKKLSIEDGKSLQSFFVREQNGEFTVQNPGLKHIQYVEVLNIGGLRLCREKVGAASDVTLPCKLNSGVYIVRIIGSDFITSIKVFVK